MEDKLSEYYEVCRSRAAQYSKLAARNDMNPGNNLAARTYLVLSTLLMTSVNAPRLNEYERFIHRSSKKLPANILDWEEWSRVLMAARKIRNASSPLLETNTSQMISNFEQQQVKPLTDVEEGLVLGTHLDKSESILQPVIHPSKRKHRPVSATRAAETKHYSILYEQEKVKHLLGKGKEFPIPSSKGRSGSPEPETKDLFDVSKLDDGDAAVNPSQPLQERRPRSASPSQSQNQSAMFPKDFKAWSRRLRQNLNAQHTDGGSSEMIDELSAAAAARPRAASASITVSSSAGKGQKVARVKSAAPRYPIEAFGPNDSRDEDARRSESANDMSKASEQGEFGTTYVENNHEDIEDVRNDQQESDIDLWFSSEKVGDIPQGSNNDPFVTLESDLGIHSKSTGISPNKGNHGSPSRPSSSNPKRGLSNDQRPLKAILNGGATVLDSSGSSYCTDTKHSTLAAERDKARVELRNLKSAMKQKDAEIEKLNAALDEAKKQTHKELAEQHTRIVEKDKDRKKSAETLSILVEHVKDIQLQFEQSVQLFSLENYMSSDRSKTDQQRPECTNDVSCQLCERHDLLLSATKVSSAGKQTKIVDDETRSYLGRVHEIRQCLCETLPRSFESLRRRHEIELATLQSTLEQRLKAVTTQSESSIARNEEIHNECRHQLESEIAALQLKIQEKDSALNASEQSNVLGQEQLLAKDATIYELQAERDELRDRCNSLDQKILELEAMVSALDDKLSQNVVPAEIEVEKYDEEEYEDDNEFESEEPVTASAEPLLETIAIFHELKEQCPDVVVQSDIISTERMAPVENHAGPLAATFMQSILKVASLSMKTRENSISSTVSPLEIVPGADHAGPLAATFMQSILKEASLSMKTRENTISSRVWPLEIVPVTDHAGPLAATFMQSILKEASLSMKSRENTISSTVSPVELPVDFITDISTSLAKQIVDDAFKSHEAVDSDVVRVVTDSQIDLSIPPQFEFIKEFATQYANSIVGNCSRSVKLPDSHESSKQGKTDQLAFERAQDNDSYIDDFAVEESQESLKLDEVRASDVVPFPDSLTLFAAERAEWKAKCEKLEIQLSIVTETFADTIVRLKQEVADLSLQLQLRVPANEPVDEAVAISPELPEDMATEDTGALMLGELGMGSIDESVTKDSQIGLPVNIDENGMKDDQVDTVDVDVQQGSKCTCMCARKGCQCQSVTVQPIDPVRVVFVEPECDLPELGRFCCDCFRSCELESLMPIRKLEKSFESTEDPHIARGYEPSVHSNEVEPVDDKWQTVAISLPEDLVINYRLGQRYLFMGRYEDALIAFSKATNSLTADLKPNCHPKFVAKLAHFLGHIWVAEAECFENLGSLNEAICLYESVIDKSMMPVSPTAESVSQFSRNILHVGIAAESVTDGCRTAVLSAMLGKARILTVYGRYEEAEKLCFSGLSVSSGLPVRSTENSVEDVTNTLLFQPLPMDDSIVVSAAVKPDNAELLALFCSYYSAMVYGLLAKINIESVGAKPCLKMLEIGEDALNNLARAAFDQHSTQLTCKHGGIGQMMKITAEIALQTERAKLLQACSKPSDARALFETILRTISKISSSTYFIADSPPEFHEAETDSTGLLFCKISCWIRIAQTFNAQCMFLQALQAVDASLGAIDVAKQNPLVQQRTPLETFWVHDFYSSALVTRAQTLTSLARHSEARNAIADALSTRQQVMAAINTSCDGMLALQVRPTSNLGADHLLLLDSLLIFGNVEFNAGNPISAAMYFQRCFDACMKLFRSEWHVYALESKLSLIHANELAHANRQLSIDQYSKLIDTIKEAEAAVGGSSDLLERTQVHIARLLSDLSKFGEAKTLVSLAGKTLCEKLGNDHLSVSDSLTTLAEIFSFCGKYQNAKRLLQRSATMVNAATPIGAAPHPRLVRILLAQAKNSLFTGQFAPADEALIRAVEILSGSSPTSSLSMCRLRACQARLRRDILFGKLFELTENELIGTDDHTNDISLAIAEVKKNVDSLEKEFVGILDDIMSCKDSDKLLYAEVLVCMGEMFRRLDRLDESRAFFDESLVIIGDQIVGKSLPAAEIHLYLALCDLAANSVDSLLSAIQSIKIDVLATVSIVVSESHPLYRYGQGVLGLVLLALAEMQSQLLLARSEIDPNTIEVLNAGLAAAGYPDPAEEGQRLIDLALESFDTYNQGSFADGHPWVLQLGGWAAASPRNSPRAGRSPRVSVAENRSGLASPSQIAAISNEVGQPSADVGPSRLEQLRSIQS